MIQPMVIKLLAQAVVAVSCNVVQRDCTKRLCHQKRRVFYHPNRSKYIYTNKQYAKKWWACFLKQKTCTLNYYQKPRINQTRKSLKQEKTLYFVHVCDFSNNNDCQQFIILNFLEESYLSLFLCFCYIIIYKCTFFLNPWLFYFAFFLNISHCARNHIIHSKFN